MKHNKWNVLIVDDEVRIGQLIKKLIDWESLNMECVDVVDNGETAYELILEKQPDIVITDIRMPKVSGLDLVRMTNEVLDDVKFIIISGYKEFEYAHKALQYGVNDYLLKPINEKELNDVLKKLTMELSENCRSMEIQNELKKTVSVSEHIIRRDLLNHIIDREQPPTRSEVEEEYNVILDAPLYRGIVIKLDYFDYTEKDKKQDRITTEKIIKIVQEILEEEVKEELICEKPGLFIYCLFNYEAEKSKHMKNVVSEILTRIQKYLMGFEQYEVTIGLGNEKNEFAQMKYSIEEAKKAVGNRIKLGVGRLIYADDIVIEDKKKPQDYVLPYKDELITALEAYSKDGVDQVINKVYSTFHIEEDHDFSICYDVAKELIKLFSENTGVESEEEDRIQKILLEAVNQCYTLTKLKSLLKDKLGEYLQISLKILETETARPVRQAKKYIDEHYAEKIVLEDIAEIVDLNPVYFSVLFKKETGENFTSYVVNVRMEKAKQMLCEGNETIAAIADKVGYKDSRYFSQLFAKSVGIKPAVYRKLHS